MMKSIIGEIFVEIPYLLKKLWPFLEVFLLILELKVFKIFSSESTEWIKMKLFMILP